MPKMQIKVLWQIEIGTHKYLKKTLGECSFEKYSHRQQSTLMLKLVTIKNFSSGSSLSYFVLVWLLTYYFHENVINTVIAILVFAILILNSNFVYSWLNVFLHTFFLEQTSNIRRSTNLHLTMWCSYCPMVSLFLFWRVDFEPYLSDIALSGIHHHHQPTTVHCWT